MFSFHKPKVYRSSTGCCICKAKSSSSRFTDSKKYELDFIECFQLTTPRRGEICNACVLLVKRFKRLPAGSNRHWGHVVDARVGPGLKSMTKFKKRKEEQKESSPSTSSSTTTKNTNGATNGATQKSSMSVPERFCKIFKKTKKKTVENIIKKKQPILDVGNSGSSDEESSPSSPMSSLSDAESSNGAHERENIKPRRKFMRKNYHPVKDRKILHEFKLIDTEFWQEKTTCCGVVYEYPMYNAIMIDLGLFKPCGEHLLQLIKSKENGVGDLEQELNGNCNTDDLLIKLTDEQIQENIENASHTGFNKISKVTDLFNTNTTALKKHHLYSKRQNVAQTSNADEKKINTNEKTDAKYPLQSNVIVQPIPRISSEELLEHSGKTNGKDNLHKIKPDGKITKNSTTDKLSALKLKPLDFNMKNLVKLCTEKGLKPKLNGTENLVKSVTGKFMSDNSSDSGYEESHEAQNLMQKPKPQNIHSIARPIILPNGIKFQVPPQLLGLPQSTIINPMSSNGTPTAPIICLPSSTVSSTTSVPQDMLLITQQSEIDSNSGTNVISVATSNNSNASQDPLSTAQVVQPQTAKTN